MLSTKNIYLILTTLHRLAIFLMIFPLLKVLQLYEKAVLWPKSLVCPDHKNYNLVQSSSSVKQKKIYSIKIFVLD